MMSAAKGELGTEVWGIQLYRIDGHGNQLCDQHIMRLYMMAINKMSAVSVVKS